MLAFVGTRLLRPWRHRNTYRLALTITSFLSPQRPISWIGGIYLQVPEAVPSALSFVLQLRRPLRADRNCSHRYTSGKQPPKCSITNKACRAIGENSLVAAADEGFVGDQDREHQQHGRRASTLSDDEACRVATAASGDGPVYPVQDTNEAALPRSTRIARAMRHALRWRGFHQRRESRLAASAPPVDDESIRQASPGGGLSSPEAAPAQASASKGKASLNIVQRWRRRRKAPVSRATSTAFVGAGQAMDSDGRGTNVGQSDEGKEDTAAARGLLASGGVNAPAAFAAALTHENSCAQTVGESGQETRPSTYDGDTVPPQAWAKADELRRRAESYDPEGAEGGALQAWLAGSADGGVGLTDFDLLRFIMFRHGDVEAAWEQLKQAAAWRLEQRASDVLSEDRCDNFGELQEEIFWIGRDTAGRPTMVLRSIAHHPGRIDSETFKRYFLYLMEQGRALWGVGAVGQMNIVVDRVGAGRKNQDPRLLANMLPIFRDAYPDIIYRCYVAPSSWIFRFVWSIGARLVDERQRKRVLLLQHEWQSRLLEDFDANVLPIHMGGTLEEYPPPQPPSMT